MAFGFYVDEVIAWLFEESTSAASTDAGPIFLLASGSFVVAGLSQCRPLTFEAGLSCAVPFSSAGFGFGSADSVVVPLLAGGSSLPPLFLLLAGRRFKLLSTTTQFLDASCCSTPLMETSMGGFFGAGGDDRMGTSGGGGAPLRRGINGRRPDGDDLLPADDAPLLDVTVGGSD